VKLLKRLEEILKSIEQHPLRSILCGMITIVVLPLFVLVFGNYVYYDLFHPHVVQKPSEPSRYQSSSARLKMVLEESRALEAKTQAVGELCEGYVEIGKALLDGDRKLPSAEVIQLLNRIDNCRQRLADGFVNSIWPTLIF
jgi:hypothetical protein